MDIIVLGAGIIGVTTAWYLRQNGHNVRVVERRPEPGLETSFANAGQVSAHLADPWANPSTLRTVFDWLLHDDTPLVFRPQADIHQWTWLAKFLRECVQSRYHQNLIHLANLGVYSRTALQTLRADIGIDYDGRQNGILLFFTDADRLRAAAGAALKLAAYGIKREVLSAQECLDLEPSLQSVGNSLQGGVYSRGDETGDAFKFTQRLAERARQAGVVFHYGASLQEIKTGKSGVDAVDIVFGDGRKETCRAQHYVLCLGSATAAQARKIGISLDIYPVKGYSVTLPVLPDSLACRMGLTDAGRKIAFSRLGDRVRATGFAEIANFDTSIDTARCQQLQDRAMALFPDALDAAQASHWAGLRPMTPSNLPYIGRSRYPNLLINAGHGTIGWTQSCGSALAISEILENRAPACDFPFLGQARH